MDVSFTPAMHRTGRRSVALEVRGPVHGRKTCAKERACRWNERCNWLRPMTTTMGQLVSDLFARYERELHDPKLAAVATQIMLAELLDQPRRKRRGA
jgi:hypothetical protein